MTRRIDVGSTVTCILERESSSISFEMNGRSCGVAFTHIPDVE